MCAANFIERMRKNIIVPTHRAKRHYHGYSYYIRGFDIKKGALVRIITNEDDKPCLMVKHKDSHVLCPFPRLTKVETFFEPVPQRA